MPLSSHSWRSTAGSGQISTVVADQHRRRLHHRGHQLPNLPTMLEAEGLDSAKVLQPTTYLAEPSTPNSSELADWIPTVTCFDSNSIPFRVRF
eukprot:1871350-Rhodomonas_salina.1